MFICLEGISAAGKTTQAELLKTRFQRELFRRVSSTKSMSPQQKLSAQQFAAALDIEPASLPMSFIYAAALSRQREAIVKKLAHNELLISDRWKESYIAYKSLYPLEFQIAAESLANTIFQKIEPHITIFIDVDPAEACCRYAARNRYDTIHASLDFEVLTKIADHYRRVSRGNERWLRIDATHLAITELHEIIWKQIRLQYNKLLRRTINSDQSLNMTKLHFIASRLLKIFDLSPRSHNACYIESLPGGHSPNSYTVKITYNSLPFSHQHNIQPQRSIVEARDAALLLWPAGQHLS